MHNGNGHGNGKRWLLIALLVLGGFWLASDSYRDGYTDALIQTGQAGNARIYRGGPHFPWGLVILGGIGYVAWRKGAFDRFSGPGGPFGGGGNGQRGIRRYDAGNGSAHMTGAPAAGSGFGAAFRGPRAVFDEWHRQAHETAWDHARQAASMAHPSPSGPQGPGAHQQTQGDNGTPREAMGQAPAPTPPAADYWTAMGAASPAGQPGAQRDEQTGNPGPATERW